MLRSMTGFGSGRARVESEELSEELSVELKSVNHKFSEVKVRLPRELAALEPAVVKSVKERLARGAVEVFVKRQAVSASGLVPTVDLALAQQYRNAFRHLSEVLQLPDQVQAKDIALQPGVIRMEEPGVQLESAEKALGQALEQALLGLVEMRRKEGEALKADLEARVATVETAAKDVAGLAPRAVDEYRQRLEERIAELSRGVSLDPQRLVQEVAYFAERTDIAEEMTRLSSHLAQFRALIASPEPAGRKMDFLVQEMHREVNTTGSKSQHPEISTRVVAMKAELERIREQVQNVE
jgi:uncharacterized protein (TIGR00255 family)